MTLEEHIEVSVICGRLIEITFNMPADNPVREDVLDIAISLKMLLSKDKTQ
jgi:hypothetical protein